MGISAEKTVMFIVPYVFVCLLEQPIFAIITTFASTLVLWIKNITTVCLVFLNTNLHDCID